MNNKFTIWKSVTIGQKPDLSDINITTYAQEIWDKIKYPVKEQTIDLVKLQVKDLDIKEDYPTTKQIYAKARKLGLELCPPQVGSELRLDYKEQPLNEWIIIGMKPIAGSDGDPNVFRLSHRDGGLWLNNIWAKPDRRWSSDYKFVFSLASSLALSPSDPLPSESAKQKKLCKHKWQLFQLREIVAVCQKCLEKKII